MEYKLKAFWDAAPVIMKLRRVVFPGKQNRDLFLAKKAIFHEIEFYEEERGKLIEKYGGADAAVNSEEFLKEFYLLGGQEVEVAGLPLVLSYVDNMGLTAEDHELIEGMIVIEYDKEGGDGACKHADGRGSAV